MNLFKKLFGKQSSKKNISEAKTNFKSEKSFDSKFSKQVDRNLKGKECEEKGETELAIEKYEANAKERFEGSHPYKRLAIIYRKKKDYFNEVRILNLAVDVFTKLSQNSPREDIKPKLQEFEKRLEKANRLMKR